MNRFQKNYTLFESFQNLLYSNFRFVFENQTPIRFIQKRRKKNQEKPIEIFISRLMERMEKPMKGFSKKFIASTTCDL